MTYLYLLIYVYRSIFNFDLNSSTGTVRAMNISSKRELLCGTIESIKDQVSYTLSLSLILLCHDKVWI